MEKSILVSIFVVFAVLTLVTLISADTGDLTSDWKVTIDGADVSSSSVSGIEAGETLPIKIVFLAEEDARDVKIKAWIDGYRNEVSDQTGRFELVEGSTYTKYLSLELPADIDPTEEYTLTIRISDKTESDDQEYTLKLQRESYNLEILAVDAPTEVTAGSVIAVNVVLKNWGMHDLEDIFAKARIADLGIEQRVYFGDLDPLDECEYEDNDYKDCGRADAVERRIYLVIPENARTGVYNLEVEAYNVDSSIKQTKSIVISGGEKATNVYSGANAKTINIGEQVSYDLVIVNSGSKMKIYTLTPEAASGLLIDVDPIVSVPGDSSKTVKVNVKATESAEEGTHVVTVNIEEEGELVKSTSFTANVEKGTVATRANSVVVLTIVLVIIFVVLLIILIVLLTKKTATMETTEGEETSYY